MEQQIKTLRERTERMQHEWLRLQGHVVKQAEQHQKMLTDIKLINKRTKHNPTNIIITLYSTPYVDEDPTACANYS